MWKETLSPSEVSTGLDSGNQHPRIIYFKAIEPLKPLSGFGADPPPLIPLYGIRAGLSRKNCVRRATSLRYGPGVQPVCHFNLTGVILRKNRYYIGYLTEKNNV